MEVHSTNNIILSSEIGEIILSSNSLKTASTTTNANANKNFQIYFFQLTTLFLILKLKVKSLQKH
jgi:hypothetical protein